MWTTKVTTWIPILCNPAMTASSAKQSGHVSALLSYYSLFMYFSLILTHIVTVICWMFPTSSDIYINLSYDSFAPMYVMMHFIIQNFPFFQGFWQWSSLTPCPSSQTATSKCITNIWILIVWLTFCKLVSFSVRYWVSSQYTDGPSRNGQWDILICIIYILVWWSLYI